MKSGITDRDSGGCGVECPTCHTVYFLEKNLNRDRMYQRLGFGSKKGWTLLCICGEQVSFEKAELKFFSVAKTAYIRGYALEGEWIPRRNLAATILDQLNLKAGPWVLRPSLSGLPKN